MEYKLDTKWLVRLMKQQYHNDKPVDILGVDVEAAAQKGEHFSSTITRVKVRTITASGAKKTQSMIVKQMKSLAEHLKPTEGFKTEIKTFLTVFQLLEGLMDEFEDKRETLWPKWYGGVPYSLMVLEDLKESGYVLIDRRKWQDLDHAMLVLRSVGRFHAMSKVLIGRGLIDEDNKGSLHDGLITPVHRALVEGGFHMMAKAMEHKLGAWPAGWEELANRLDKLKPLILDKLKDLRRNYDKKFDASCHGDLWSSNMMFKIMEYTEIPISVKFLDYEGTHVNSFGWDVIYYLYSTVKPSIRRSHLRQLLEVYHQSLVDNLHFYKYPGYVPSLEDVINEEKRLAVASLAFLVCDMPMNVASGNDAFFLENVLNGSPEEYYNMNAYVEEKLVLEIGDDLKCFARSNVF